MASLRRAREPVVISLSLIRTAIEEHEKLSQKCDVDNSGYVPTSPEDVLALRLSFKRIHKIENLSYCGNLRELRLDNNKIETIEGIEHLKHLEVLDLSFNSITQLQNLRFPKLTDLSLFNNELTAIAGLDDCPNVQCLSLGNNQIGELQQVLQLRGHKGLRALSLDGNPMCTASRNGYRYFCAAFLPQLKYLDAQLITLSEISAAREGGVPAELLAEVEDKEANEAKTKEKEAALAAKLALLAAGNLDATVTLFDSLFADDADYAKWRTMHGVPQALEEFKAAFKTSADELAAVGMEKSRAIDVNKVIMELKDCEDASQRLTASATERLAADFASWEKGLKNAARATAAAAAGGGADSYRTPRSRTIDDEDDDGEPALGSEELSADLHAIGQRALTAEMQCHEAVDSFLDVLESAVSELKQSKLASHETFFRAVESHQNAFYGSCHQLAERALAEFSTSPAKHAAEAYDDELYALLADRDALFVALSTSHEAHLTRIAAAEAQLQAREDKRCNGAVGDMRAKELRRNRTRIAEIRAMVDSGVARVDAALGEAAAAAANQQLPADFAISLPGRGHVSVARAVTTSKPARAVN